MLITIDTLRADRLSCYGYDKGHTPTFYALAAQGVLFEQAMCDIPWTTGSMASVMTGTLGPRHGVHLRTERLGTSQRTLAELLRERGYRTAAVVGSFAVSAVYGLDQGFQSFDDEFTRPLVGAAGDDTVAAVAKVPDPTHGANGSWINRKLRNDACRSDAEVSERAVAWLRKNRNHPFFLWVHYLGPHERLFTGVGAVSQQEPRIIADYDRDLQKTDAALKTLLSAIGELGLNRDLLLVLHADHGQSLGEHQFVGHGNDLYDVSVHVPLLMRSAGRIPAGQRVRQLVRNVDILPTILELLALPRPAGLNGRSLVAAISGKAMPDLPSYSETYVPTVSPWPMTVPGVGVVLGPVARYALRTEHWKFVENKFSPPCAMGISAHRSTRAGWFDKWELQDPKTLVPDECGHLHDDELYDLAADPGEVRNLAAEHPDVTQQLAARLGGMMAGHAEAEDAGLSTADRERLRSLGYDSGEGSAQRDPQ